MGGPAAARRPAPQPPACAPTASAPAAVAPTASAPTTCGPTAVAPAACAPTTCAPTAVAPAACAPTTCAPAAVAPAASATGAAPVGPAATAPGSAPVAACAVLPAAAPLRPCRAAIAPSPADARPPAGEPATRCAVPAAAPRPVGPAAARRVAAARAATMAAALTSALTAAAAHAQDPEPARPWSAQITPYVWAAGSTGSLRPFAGGPTLSGGQSFGDILRDLDAAFFVTGFARYGRLVGFADVTHAALSRGGRVAGVPASGAFTQTSATLAGGWRVLADPAMTVDALAGVRAWRLDLDVSAGGAISRSPERSFVDPIVGARVNVALAPDWSLLLQGDVGGFGAGSRATGQLAAVVNYRLTDNAWVSAGWRHLYLDYDRGGVRAEVQLGGPLLGATWRF